MYVFFLMYLVLYFEFYKNLNNNFKKLKIERIRF